MEFCLKRARAMVQMSDGLSIENTRCATPGGLLVSGRDELEANICNAEQRLSEVLKAQDREGWRAAFKWWRSLR
jgi:hypothetical protein